MVIERCPKCGKPCLQCRCKVSPCHLPVEEEADGELEEIEIPEEEKHDAHKKKEKIEEEIEKPQ
jgi:hypothetical protein